MNARIVGESLLEPTHKYVLFRTEHNSAYEKKASKFMLFHFDRRGTASNPGTFIDPKNQVKKRILDMQKEGQQLLMSVNKEIGDVILHMSQKFHTQNTKALQSNLQGGIAKFLKHGK